MILMFEHLINTIVRAPWFPFSSSFIIELELITLDGFP